MYVDFVYQDHSGRLLKNRRNLTVFQGNIRDETRVLHDGLGCNVGDQRNHHPLPGAEVRERLRLALDRQDDLLSVTVVPKIVGFGYATKDGLLHDFVTPPPAPGTIGGRNRFALKPDSEITQSDSLFEAVVERLPTARGTARLEPGRATGSRRKPGAPRSIVGDHGTRHALARAIPREVVLYNLQGSRGLGVGGSRPVESDLPAPLDMLTGNLASRGDGHRLALDELPPVTYLPHVEANLVSQDVPPAVREHGIGWPDEPDPGRNRQRIENRRLSGAVVTHKEGEPGMQLQRVVRESLEVLYPKSIDFHVSPYPWRMRLHRDSRRLFADVLLKGNRRTSPLVSARGGAGACFGREVRYWWAACAGTSPPQTLLRNSIQSPASAGNARLRARLTG